MSYHRAKMQLSHLQAFSFLANIRHIESRKGSPPVQLMIPDKRLRASAAGRPPIDHVVPNLIAATAVANQETQQSHRGRSPCRGRTITSVSALSYRRLQLRSLILDNSSFAARLVKKA